MKLSELKIGFTFNHHAHGEGMVTAVTARTVTATFKKGFTSKLTYRSKDANFSIFDF